MDLQMPVSRLSCPTCLAGRVETIALCTLADQRRTGYDDCDSSDGSQRSDLESNPSTAQRSVAHFGCLGSDRSRWWTETRQDWFRWSGGETGQL